MPTNVEQMNVSLTPYLERFVRDRVKSGRFNSASEVVRVSLRLLEEYEAEKEAKLEALRRDLQQGIDELDQGLGEPFDAEDIIRRGRERYQARMKSNA